MPSIIKVDQIQSDTGSVAVNGNINFDSGLVYVDATNNRLAVGNPSDANQSLRIDFPDSGSARINSTRLASGALQNLVLAGQDTIQFFTNGTERLRIPVDAGGIRFPATQVSSSDPNTLDDYEEGTWTPTISSSGASGFTFLDQNGWYVKIGRQVSIFFRVNVASLSSASGTSTVFVSGLPFTATSGNGIQGGLVLIDATRWGSNFPTAGYIAGAATNITLSRAIGSTALGSDPTLIQASDLRTGSSFNGNTVQGSMTYLVAT